MQMHITLTFGLTMNNPKLKQNNIEINSAIYRTSQTKF